LVSCSADRENAEEEGEIIKKKLRKQLFHKKLLQFAKLDLIFLEKLGKI
jgi:hypothetical protein